MGASASVNENVNASARCLWWIRACFLGPKNESPTVVRPVCFRHFLAHVLDLNSPLFWLQPVSGFTPFQDFWRQELHSTDRRFGENETIEKMCSARDAMRANISSGAGVRSDSVSCCCYCAPLPSVVPLVFRGKPCKILKHE